MAWCGSIELANEQRGKRAREHAEVLICPITRLKVGKGEWKALRHSCWTR